MMFAVSLNSLAHGVRDLVVKKLLLRREVHISLIFIHEKKW